MNVIGNILRIASKKIPTVAFDYRILVSITTNSIGNIVPTYSNWTSANGHVQPGLTFSFNARGISNPGLIAKQLGIDQSKEIVTVYAYGLNLRNVHDQDQPDQIRYNGKIYNIWSISNWFEYDGWKSLVCVEDTRERSAT